MKVSDTLLNLLMITIGSGSPIGGSLVPQVSNIKPLWVLVYTFSNMLRPLHRTEFTLQGVETLVLRTRIGEKNKEFPTKIHFNECMKHGMNYTNVCVVLTTLLIYTIVYILRNATQTVLPLEPFTSIIIITNSVYFYTSIWL